MKIQVEIKTVYGNSLIYPVCNQAKLFAKLAGNQKTLTRENIDLIKELGYVIDVRQSITEL